MMEAKLGRPVLEVLAEHAARELQSSREVLESEVYIPAQGVVADDQGKFEVNQANPAFELLARDVSNVNNWHFAMLNDVDRNAKFDLAIREAVAALAPEVGRVRVLDLGAGSGLLSMMAARAGAEAPRRSTRSARSA